MRNRLPFLACSVLLAGCGGAVQSDNGGLQGTYDFVSIAFGSSSTTCPGTVTVDDVAHTCGQDSIAFDGNGTFTSIRNGSTGVGNYSYSRPNLILNGGGESRTATITQDGDTLRLSFQFSDESWTLRRHP